MQLELKYHYSGSKQNNYADAEEVYNVNGTAQETVKISPFKYAPEIIKAVNSEKTLRDLLAEAVILMRRNPDMREIELMKRIREATE